MNIKAISAVLILLIAANTGFAQINEARQSIERGEYVRAVNILSAELAERPSADVYLYMGIAYAHKKEYPQAEDTFHEGIKLYPEDVRLRIELANLFLAVNDIESSQSELRQALSVDPNN